jgi:hypothetical protein
MWLHLFRDAIRDGRLLEQQCDFPLQPSIRWILQQVRLVPTKSLVLRINAAVPLSAGRTVRSAFPHSVWKTYVSALLGLLFVFLDFLRILTVPCRISSAASSGNVRMAFDTPPRNVLDRQHQQRYSEVRPFA